MLMLPENVWNLIADWDTAPRNFAVLSPNNYDNLREHWALDSSIIARDASMGDAVTETISRSSDSMHRPVMIEEFTLQCIGDRSLWTWQFVYCDDRLSSHSLLKQISYGIVMIIAMK